MGWTDERVELLTRLWSEGLSASQIATQLGGVTRNAVIGKVHRLKLEGRARVSSGVPAAAGPAEEDLTVEIEVEAPVLAMSAPLTFVGAQGSMRPMARMQGAAALKIEPDLDIVADAVPERVSGEVVPISRNLTLVQLSDRTCKWPLGDPLSADFRFCGNHSNDASPYCVYHARIAFQPVSERRRVR